MSTPESCAWCLRELGITPQSGSHGICQRHADEMRAQHTRRRAYREGNIAVLRARSLTRTCVGMLADAGLLATISPEGYACDLAHGLLSEYVARHIITVAMIERWVQEMQANARE